jgi:hypothetical protein
MALFTLLRRGTGSGTASGLAVLLYAASPQFYFLEAQFSHQAVATALLVALACLLVRSLPASARRRDSRRTAAETPKVSVDTSTRPRRALRRRPSAGPPCWPSRRWRTRTRSHEPPDVTARHRVGDDADRDDGHQPVAAHPPAVGVLLTHRPPWPPPSLVPSPGYAFAQPLTRITIVT